MRVVAGAHDALSARLASEAGFDGLWASGFGMAAASCLPDLGVMGVLETLQRSLSIRHSTSLPVYVDCNDGFGDPALTAIMAERAAASGLAGICIEDKEGPKNNSFRDGGMLADCDAMAAKIAAARAAHGERPFTILARTEALVVGGSVEDALRRALHFREAGADGVLIHASNPDPTDVLSTCRQVARHDPEAEIWVVPTKFPQTPRGALEDAGVSVVVYANQAIRAAVTAMRSVLTTLMGHSPSQVEDVICEMDDIFLLTGTPELERLRTTGSVHLGEPDRLVGLTKGADHRA